MAWNLVQDLGGTGVKSTSGVDASATLTSDVQVGDILIIWQAADNVGTTDLTNNTSAEHTTSVSGGSWSPIVGSNNGRMYEVRRGGGSKAGGSTVSVHAYVATAVMAAGSSITATANYPVGAGSTSMAQTIYAAILRPDAPGDVSFVSGVGAVGSTAAAANLTSNPGTARNYLAVISRGFEGSPVPLDNAASGLVVGNPSIAGGQAATRMSLNARAIDTGSVSSYTDSQSYTSAGDHADTMVLIWVKAGVNASSTLSGASSVSVSATVSSPPLPHVREFSDNFDSMDYTGNWTTDTPTLVSYESGQGPGDNVLSLSCGSYSDSPMLVSAKSYDLKDTIVQITPIGIGATGGGYAKLGFYSAGTPEVWIEIHRSGDLSVNGRNLSVVKGTFPIGLWEYNRFGIRYNSVDNSIDALYYNYDDGAWVVAASMPSDNNPSTGTGRVFIGWKCSIASDGGLGYGLFNDFSGTDLVREQSISATLSSQGTLTASTDAKRPSIATFVEEFTDLSQWTGAPASFNLTDGELRLASGVTSSGVLFSAKAFDLRSGERLVGYLQVGPNASAQFGLNGPNGVIGLAHIDTTNNVFGIQNDPTDATAAEAYNPVDHAWISIRMDVATEQMVLETSPAYDGTEVWTEQARIDLDYLVSDVGDAFVMLSMGASSPDAVVIDHINSPVALTSPGIDTLVDSFTGTDGSPLDASKWTIDTSSGTVGAEIQGNQARMWTILQDTGGPGDAYENAFLDSVKRYSLVNKTLRFKWDISQVGFEFAEFDLLDPVNGAIDVFVDDENGSQVRSVYISTDTKTGSSFQWDITQPLWWRWTFTENAAGGVDIHIETSPTGYDNWTVREEALATDDGFDVNNVLVEFAIYGNNYRTPDCAVYIDDFNIEPVAPNLVTATAVASSTSSAQATPRRSTSGTVESVVASSSINGTTRKAGTISSTLLSGTTISAGMLRRAYLALATSAQADAGAMGSVTRPIDVTMSATSSVGASAAALRGIATVATAASTMTLTGAREGRTGSMMSSQSTLTGTIISGAVSATLRATSSMSATALAERLTTGVVSIATGLSVSALKTGLAALSVGGSSSTETQALKFLQSGSGITTQSGFVMGGTISGGTTNGFGYYRSVTIDHTKVAGDLANFPVLVTVTHPTLASVANGGRVTSALGHDIILTSDLGGNQVLDHEIENYDPTTGALSLWVRVPVLASTFDTTLYLFYGNSNVTTSQQNAAGVWDSSYAAVYHLSRGGLLSAQDSTANANDGVITGDVSGVSGPVGEGAAFGTTRGNYIDLGARASIYNALNGSFTIDMWVNIPDGSQLLWGSSGPPSNRLIGYDAWNPNNIVFNEENMGSVQFVPYTSYLDSWHKLTWRYDATTHTSSAYIDGQFVGSSVYTFTAPYEGAYSIGDRSSTYPLLGRLDEVRVANVARSPEWLATEYANQDAPATFVQIGAEQNVSGGSSESSAGVLVTRYTGATLSSLASVGVGALAGSTLLGSSAIAATSTVSAGAATQASSGAVATATSSASGHVRETVGITAIISAAASVSSMATNGNVAAVLFATSSLAALTSAKRTESATLPVATGAGAGVLKTVTVAASMASTSQSAATGVKETSGTAAISAASSASSRQLRTRTQSMSSGVSSSTQASAGAVQRGASNILVTSQVAVTPQGQQLVSAALGSTSSTASGGNVEHTIRSAITSVSTMACVVVRGIKGTAPVAAGASVSAVGSARPGVRSTISTASTTQATAQRTVRQVLSITSGSLVTTKAGRSTRAQTSVASQSSTVVGTDGSKFITATLTTTSTTAAGVARAKQSGSSSGSTSYGQAVSIATRGAVASLSDHTGITIAPIIQRFVQIQTGAVSQVTAGGRRTGLAMADVTVHSTTDTNGQRAREIRVAIAPDIEVNAEVQRTSLITTVVPVTTDMAAAGLREAFADLVISNLSSLVLPGVYVPVLSVPGQNRMALEGLSHTHSAEVPPRDYSVEPEHNNKESATRTRMIRLARR